MGLQLPEFPAKKALICAPHISGKEKENIKDMAG